MRLMSVEFGEDGGVAIQYMREEEIKPDSTMVHTVYLSMDGVEDRQYVKYWANELAQAAEELVEWWGKYERGVA